MTDSTTHRPRLAVALALVCLVVTAAVAPAVVAAQSSDGDEDSVLDRLLDEENEETKRNLVDATVYGLTHPGESLGAISASFADASYNYNPLYEHKRTPSECADDLQAEVNNNPGATATYVNDRVNATASRDVIKVTCQRTDDGDTTASTFYLVADVNDSTGDYENVSAADSTSRTVDHEVLLDGYAVDNLPDDYEAFSEDYIDANETPNKGYTAKMASKYNGHVYGTFGFLDPLSEAE